MLQGIQRGWIPASPLNFAGPARVKIVSALSCLASHSIAKQTPG